MTYLDYINQFWRISELANISASQTQLYFAILDEANAFGWEFPVAIPNRKLIVKVGMSEPTLISTRNKLKQLGLIDFDPGKRKASPPLYYLNFFSKNFSKNFSILKDNKIVDISPYNPPKGETASKSSKVVRLDFVDEHYRIAFGMWLDYKQERKQSYKSATSLKMCYKKLLEISEYNPDTALAIVEQSIANNWSGLFCLKNKDYGNAETNRRNPPTKQERERGFACHIATKLARGDVNEIPDSY